MQHVGWLIFSKLGNPLPVQKQFVNLPNTAKPHLVLYFLLAHPYFMQVILSAKVVTVRYTVNCSYQIVK